MTHHFCVEVANEVGIEGAILLENIYFWCQRNKANDKLKNGKPYTYNSVKAFNQLFPYMKPSTIYRALKKLESEGFIESGEFNANAYDRTKWYCTTEKANSYYETPTQETQESKKIKPIEEETHLVREKEPKEAYTECFPQTAYAQEIFKIWHGANLKGAKDFISFLSRDFKLALPKLHDTQLHSDEVIQACKNYAAVIELKRKRQTWWKCEYMFYDFAKYESIGRFLPDNFDIEAYRTEASKTTEKNTTRSLEEKSALEES